MAPQEKPTLKQALLITLGGLFFAFFSCVGALASLGNNGSTNALAELGFVGFGLGLLVLITGIVLVLWVAFRPFFRKRMPQPDELAPTQSPQSPQSTDSPSQSEPPA